ncbi:hypothetical protein BC939DRAFT_1068 [Gamsiella multidivaricata]|uniref:uncharacterized protein n=1 Tax=Gamsiella multidivaricata TaxID=101098 RepID=UPI002220F267|nr:uncharacterized protein BC939DRAFT_1068 [Gamsiella multidivaricata]KAG0353263.1 hypothetical protein BGZ54_002325 [Gamsiella multidivaricata]KAI7832560.1 hypothetical protein BC939DRAFT_1068 [Gamsiella multidivaricata]
MPPSPKVLIIGAGIGGITLALLLERIGIDYEVFERAKCVKPLGAAMSIGPNILPVFEQLGLIDEIMKVSLPATTMEVYKENMELIGRTDNTAFIKQRSGYDPIMFSRPDVHNLLLSKVPASKIHYSKRVLSVGQSDTGVLIRCTDGQTHEGDILIGADGAYSAVRQSLYDRLQKDGMLPASDSQSLNLGYSCMVGTTLPQDPEKYPILKDNHAHFAVVVADGKPHSWTIISVPGNRICFGIVIQLKGEEKDETFRNSEWGPESIDSMVAQVAHHKIPFGGTLGDLINATPKELISKTHLEEKLFETWTHKRIALIGDACHKMLPSAGQGAINAMQDAVIVANCLYDLKSLSQKHIAAALEDYKAQRYGQAKKQVQISNMVGRVLYGQTWFEKFMRKAVFNWLPRSFEESSFIKSVEYRPQATFLPFVDNPAKLPILPQKMSKRYAEEQKLKKEKDAESTPVVDAV